MNLHTLKPAAGSTKNRKRIGRGQGSGFGGTSTRGHKGAKSRSGYKKKLGFEGGQMPLQRRVPKFGFKPLNRVEYKPINLVDIQFILDKEVTNRIDLDVLINNGFAKKNDKIKILAKGELKSKVDIEAHACSKMAIKAIEKVGGKYFKA